MKVAASNHSYQLIVGKKIPMETTTFLQFVTKFYFNGANFQEFWLLHENVKISPGKTNTMNITSVVKLWLGIIWK